MEHPTLQGLWLGLAARDQAATWIPEFDFLMIWRGYKKGSTAVSAKQHLMDVVVKKLGRAPATSVQIYTVVAKASCMTLSLVTCMLDSLQDNAHGVTTQAHLAVITIEVVETRKLLQVPASLCQEFVQNYSPLATPVSR